MKITSREERVNLTQRISLILEGIRADDSMANDGEHARQLREIADKLEGADRTKVETPRPRTKTAQKAIITQTLRRALATDGGNIIGVQFSRGATPDEELLTIGLRCIPAPVDAEIQIRDGAKYDLLSREVIDQIISSRRGELETNLALEVREYRRCFGPLGCDWLSADDNPRPVSAPVYHAPPVGAEPVDPTPDAATALDAKSDPIMVKCPCCGDDMVWDTVSNAPIATDWCQECRDRANSLINDFDGRSGYAGPRLRELMMANPEIVQLIRLTPT